VQLDDRSPWFDRLVGPGTLPAVAAVTPSQVAAVLGRRDAAAALALGSGRPVLATPQQALAGRRVRAGLDISTTTGERYVGTPDGYTALATGPVPSVLLTTDLVSRLGLHVAGAVVFARLGSPLQPAEEQALQLELFRINPSLFAQQDPGYRDRYAALSTAFLIGGAVVAVIAAVVATALAGVERRRDVQTLAAVGARPALRWRMSMVQAAVIAVLGTALGLGAGFIAPAAYVLAMNRASGPGGSGMRLDAPWTSLGALVVVVPLAAVLLAGLFGRGRLPAERARVFAG
jgi:putative ABC transport system permease protein